MKLQIAMYPSDEGFAVSVPSLPGCWSQGATRDEALKNIMDAVREYLDTENEPPSTTASTAGSGPNGPALCEGAEIREVEVAD